MEEWEKLEAKASWEYSDWTNEDLTSRLKDIGEMKGEEEIKLIAAELRSRLRWLTDELLRCKEKLRKVVI
jgi:predicted alpha/beta hydrolase